MYFFCLCWGFTAQSTQWGHVEHDQFTLPHVYWAGLVLKVVNQYCAHSYARNWQLIFINQWKGENDPRKYFTINLHERMLPTSAGVEPAISWSPVRRASNWATEAGYTCVNCADVNGMIICLDKSGYQILMSTHNMLCGEIRKISTLLDWKKKHYINKTRTVRIVILV